jgi:hypothetical protein
MDVSLSLNVQPILSAKCVLTCHTANSMNNFYPILDPGFTWLSTVNAPACDPANPNNPNNPFCPPHAAAVLVVPGNLAASAVHRVTSPPLSLMPPAASQPLSPSEAQLLADWITQGAKNN